MANIKLTSKRPMYGGRDWGVVGMGNKRILAIGVFFYDVANIAPSNLQFREALCAWDFAVEQFDIESAAKAYVIEESQLMDSLSISHELGSIGLQDGWCLVIPNILQYKIPELKLADKTKPGHCKMLRFFYVDPGTRIPSMEIVPPQQQDWYFQDVLTSEPFCRLPQLIVDVIIKMVDFLILFKEAKKLRPQSG
ncbi:hypothetical protein IWW39_002812 [Coemansia spiralis]|uniref:DUF4246 domain-containing protein n=1 Tax=Coemansia spiralis TaxID=417178 RepID=A0A9W8GJQ1_9FUNG|nr:hypothetical protein IWW39_002812 [Coemansia spiralis]